MKPKSKRQILRERAKLRRALRQLDYMDTIIAELDVVKNYWDAVSRRRSKTSKRPTA